MAFRIIHRKNGAIVRAEEISIKDGKSTTRNLFGSDVCPVYRKGGDLADGMYCIWSEC